MAALFGSAYSDYKKQVLKVNLFDEYCWLRSQELVKQNEYLFQHEGKYWVRQISRSSSGTQKTWEKPWARSPGKPTTTTPVILRTLNSSSKTSSTDTWTHLPNPQWVSSPPNCHSEQMICFAKILFIGFLFIPFSIHHYQIRTCIFQLNEMLSKRIFWWSSKIESWLWEKNVNLKNCKLSTSCLYFERIKQFDNHHYQSPRIKLQSFGLA